LNQPEKLEGSSNIAQNKCNVYVCAMCIKETAEEGRINGDDVILNR
jgi:hypothetical protein